MSLTLGTLCTGIGLMDLGLERAGIGPTLWQCEVLPERRAVLRHHFPGAKLYEDVRTVGTPEHVDVVAFGSPCKNLSSAGDRSGLDGPSSSLFWDCLAVVERVRPRWVVFENVASGASLWVDRVRGALERAGYETLPVPVSAGDLGAPHRRGRVFVVAHLASKPPGRAPGQEGEEAAPDPDVEGEHALAEHAEVASPQAPADAEGSRREEGREPEERSRRALAAERGWERPEPDLVRVVHGGARRMDGIHLRVAALGDSCVPAQAEVIGHLIRMLDG